MYYRITGKKTVIEYIQAADASDAVILADAHGLKVEEIISISAEEYNRGRSVE